MRVVHDDLFAATPKVDAICITTNMQVKRNGMAICGAGIALTAAKRWAVFPIILGQLLKKGIKQVAIVIPKADHYPAVIAFPTKDDWRNPSSIELIKTGLEQLKQMADDKDWTNVWLPSLGTNNGKLPTAVVWPIMHEYLDDRFTLVLRG